MNLEQWKNYWKSMGQTDMVEQIQNYQNEQIKKERNTIINKDDVINLKIILETQKDVLNVIRKL